MLDIIELSNKSQEDLVAIAKELNVIQENDTSALEKIVDEVLSDPACAKAVEDFKAGSEKVLGFLVGQVMKASKGKANPAAETGNGTDLRLHELH